MKLPRLAWLAVALLPLWACTKADIRIDGAGGMGGEGGAAGDSGEVDGATDDDARGDLDGGGGGAGAEAGRGGGTAGAGGAAGGRGGQTPAGGAGGRTAQGGGAGQATSGGAGGRGGAGGGGASNGGAAGTAGGTTGQGGAGGATAIPTCIPEATVTGPMAPFAVGQLVVSELMHRTVALSDNVGEWFEIYNPSANTSFELQGCVITDNSTTSPATHTISSSVVVPPCSYRTFAISTSAGFTPSYVYGSTANPVKFGNDHEDGVRLLCGGNVLVASFHYSLDEAMNAPYNGKSFSVDPRHLDPTANNAGNYCPGKVPYIQSPGLNYGSPGAVNPVCP